MKLLLIDDSDLALMILERDLKKYLDADDEVIKIKDSEKALEFIKENEVDAVFTDLTMPKITGIELLSKIKEIKADVKVIIVSAEVQKSRMDKAFELGAYGFFNKPVNKDELEKIVKGLR